MTPSPAESVERPTIVVGVDGSSGSQTALEFALAEGSLRGAAVHIVYGWEYPVCYGGGFILPAETFEAEGAAIVKDAMSRAIETFTGGPTPSMHHTVEWGHPAKMLLAAASGAELLVVGSRGRGGFLGLVLGSVSQACAGHAACPVVVVPEPPQQQNDQVPAR